MNQRIANRTTDQVANIILWTVVECGVGIVAGSLPALRAFFKSLAKDKSTNDYSASHASDLLTFGRVRDRSKRGDAIELGINTVVNHDAEGSQEQDDDSTRRIIKVRRSFRVEEAESDEERLCNESGRKGG